MDLKNMRKFSKMYVIGHPGFKLLGFRVRLNCRRGCLLSFSFSFLNVVLGQALWRKVCPNPPPGSVPIYKSSQCQVEVIDAIYYIDA